MGARARSMARSSLDARLGLARRLVAFGVLGTACLALLLASAPAAGARVLHRPQPRLRAPLRLSLDSDGPLVPSPATAPWSALILAQKAADPTGLRCSGSIISSTQILTAGHCTHDDVENNSYAPGDYTVKVGIVNTADTATQQTDSVASIRVMPGYVYQSSSASDPYDLAELTLTTPLQFTASVQPVQVIGQGATPPLGSGVTSYGWGEWGPGNIDGLQRMYQSTLIQPWLCASGQSSTLCSVSASVDACPADSGSGLVPTGVPPALVGVLDYTSTGASGVATCSRNDATGSVDLASPQYQQFLAGAPVTLGPYTTGAPDIDAGSDQVGSTVTCTSPAWSGAPVLSYLFVDADSHAVLQSGPSSYVVPPAMLGHQITCVAVATNPGATAYAVSDYETTAVLPQSVPGVGIDVSKQGAFAASLDADGQPLTLTVTATLGSGGLVAFSQIYANATGASGSLKALAPGAYSVCVSTASAGVWTSANKCVSWIHNGAAVRYLRLRVGRRHRQPVLSLTALAPIRRAHVKVKWVGERAGHRVRVTRRVRLRAHSRLRPPAGRKLRGARWLQVTVTLQRRAWQGAVLRAGFKRVSLEPKHRRRQGQGHAGHRRTSRIVRPPG